MISRPPLKNRHDVIVVGGGAAGLAAAASLLRRRPGLDIAVIDPADNHYYQPGWTLVGAGVFSPQTTVRSMSAVMPKSAHWERRAVEAFAPDQNQVILSDGQRLLRPVWWFRGCERELHH